MFQILICLILVAMISVLVFTMRTDSVYEKILAVNTFGTITVLFIMLYGFLNQRFEIIDIALTYVLINFIVTIAALRFFEESEEDSDNTLG